MKISLLVALLGLVCLVNAKPTEDVVTKLGGGYSSYNNPRYEGIDIQDLTSQYLGSSGKYSSLV